MANKLTHYEKIEQMLKRGWTSPLDAWIEWSILTSFRSRISEIREDYRYDAEFALEERTKSKKNRDGSRVTYKELRLVPKKKTENNQGELFAKGGAV